MRAKNTSTAGHAIGPARTGRERTEFPPYGAPPDATGHQANQRAASSSLPATRGNGEQKTGATRPPRVPLPAPPKTAAKSFLEMSDGSAASSGGSSADENTSESFPLPPSRTPVAASPGTGGNHRLDDLKMSAAIQALREGDGLGVVIVEHVVTHWRDQALLSEVLRQLQAESRGPNTAGGTERLMARLQSLTLARGQSPSEDQ
jgi:hypothetical protein